MEKKRCGWPSDDALMIKYHDTEWGVPVHDDTKWYEKILLDGFQAGLSWKTILHKRENFRKAFDHFDYKKIAKYDDAKLQSLMQDAGIIRNKLKINSSKTNAIAFMKVQEEFGSFDKYIWQFVGGKPIVNKRKSISEMPATSKESDALSKDLKKRGFKFVGSTICYAFMQSAGMVNDHTVECFRWKEVQELY
ncbi:MAG: DNA-3-methyladenine glycosylase I [Bacteroidetes bacterium]|nr:DNA-3-methyladenine glycosylase I [Bacteroidota bacterium]